MNREPVLFRAVARILGLIASCLWKASRGPDIAAQRLDRVAKAISDAGFKVNAAGIWLLEQAQGEYVEVSSWQSREPRRVRRVKQLP